MKAQRLAITTAAAVALLLASVRGTQATPWTQQARLLASDGAEQDFFGRSVSLSGSTAIVGAYGDDDGGGFSGSAYVFEKTGGDWAQTAKLTVPGGGALWDYFGLSVSASGSTALVGAYGYPGNGTASGSAYVFEKVGGLWTPTAGLLASDGGAGDGFGSAVSVNGTTAVVGAWMNGDQGFWAGSAYIFERVGAGWEQTARLLPSDVSAGGQFGCSVSVCGSVAVVGARFQDGRTGTAYVFEKVDGAWTQTAKLANPYGGYEDCFGAAVSVSGTTVVVGACQDSDCGTWSGSAFVFQKEGNNWVQTAKLLPSDGAAWDFFGDSVCIDGSTILVGAYGDDERGDSSGAVYAFEKVGEEWVQTAKLLSPDESADFGASVSLSGTTALIGAPWGDGAVTDSGLSFVFEAEAVPEPATLLLVGSGAVGAFGVIRRWKR